MRSPSIYAAALMILTTAAMALSGCGQSVRGELPDVATQTGSVLTAEEVKAAAEALVRAKEERQAADIAQIERPGSAPLD